MNKIIRSVAITLALASPLAAFAQTNGPTTRAQVKDQLIQLERAGYSPSTGSDVHYPSDLQGAESRAGMLNGNGYNSAGGVSNGSSQSSVTTQDGFAAAPAAAR